MKLNTLLPIILWFTISQMSFMHAMEKPLNQPETYKDFMAFIATFHSLSKEKKLAEKVIVFEEIKSINKDGRRPEAITHFYANIPYRLHTDKDHLRLPNYPENQMYKLYFESTNNKITLLTLAHPNWLMVRVEELTEKNNPTIKFSYNVYS